MPMGTYFEQRVIVRKLRQTFSIGILWCLVGGCASHCTSIPHYRDELKAEILFKDLESIGYVRLSERRILVEFSCFSSFFSSIDVLLTHDLSMGEDYLCLTLFGAEEAEDSGRVLNPMNERNAFIIDARAVSGVPTFSSPKIVYRDSNGFYPIRQQSKGSKGAAPRGSAGSGLNN
jgi:hypothetical protein